MDAAKSEVVEKLRLSTGCLFDTPTNQGGNTNSGVLAKKFFAPESRENI